MNKKGLIQFRFVELFTGNKISKMYHVVKTEKGVLIAEGNTDSNGLTVWISRDVGDTLYVYVKNAITGELKEKVRHTVIYKKEIVRILTSKILLDNIVLSKTTNTAGNYRYSTHKVKSGETLTSIAHHYVCKLNTLVEMNKLPNPDQISVGQIIKIPYKSNLSANKLKKTTETKEQTHHSSTPKPPQSTQKQTQAHTTKNSSIENKQSTTKKSEESILTSILKRIESINIFDDQTKENGKPMKVAQNATSACICNEYGLAWGNKVNCEFRKKVIKIANSLWPHDAKNMASQLMAVMHLESAGSFSPSIGTFIRKKLTDEANGGYVGLIQFGKGAASDLHVKRSVLAKMSAIAQLDYVEKYYLLGGANTKIHSLTGLYLWVNYPKNVKENRLGDEDIVYAAPKNADVNSDKFKKSAYHQNPSFMKEEGEFVKKGKNVVVQGIKNGSTKVWEVEKEIKKHLTMGLDNLEDTYTCDYGKNKNTNAPKAKSSKINLDKFADTLRRRAENESQHACAKYVRIALEAAGADTTGHPVPASDWGPTLLKIGYKEITAEFNTPQKGDIYIITKTQNHKYGHIAGFDGSQWISDFKQKSQVIYRDKVSYRYFRI